MATIQGKASDREVGKNQTLKDIDTKQQLAAVRAWAKRLEKHFFLVQNTSRDALQLAGTNVSPQCQLSGWQKNSLARKLNTLSAAVSDLLCIFADLHDFGILLNELRNWKGPVRKSNWRTNGLASRSYAEVTFFLNRTYSSLDGTRYTSQKCQLEQFCTDAKKTLVYLDRLPFILPAKRLQLEYLVSLACKNESGQERNDSGDKSSSDETACPAMGRGLFVWIFWFWTAQKTSGFERVTHTHHSLPSCPTTITSFERLALPWLIRTGQDLSASLGAG